MQGEQLTLMRCATTMQPCSTHPHWQCGLCCRLYCEVQELTGPTCLYCGVALGTPAMQGCVQPVPALML